MLPSSFAPGLTAPLIVKPLVACGVSHSHSMALVLDESALCQLGGRVPLPAVVQEFVNHGGQQYKVYVLADKVSSMRWWLDALKRSLLMLCAMVRLTGTAAARMRCPSESRNSREKPWQCWLWPSSCNIRSQANSLRADSCTRTRTQGCLSGAQTSLQNISAASCVGATEQNLLDTSPQFSCTCGCPLLPLPLPPGVHHTSIINS